MVPRSTRDPLGDAALAASLGRLWQHREHESNALKQLFCQCGLHRWRQLDLSKLPVNNDVRYCFWCSKLKIDGIVHEL